MNSRTLLMYASIATFLIFCTFYEVFAIVFNPIILETNTVIRNNIYVGLWTYYWNGATYNKYGDGIFIYQYATYNSSNNTNQSIFYWLLQLNNIIIPLISFVILLFIAIKLYKKVDFTKKEFSYDLLLKIIVLFISLIYYLFYVTIIAHILSTVDTANFINYSTLIIFVIGWVGLLLSIIIDFIYYKSQIPIT